MVAVVPAGDQTQASTDVRAGTRQPTILVIGLKPERLLDSEGRIDAFLEPPTQEQGETLIEAVRSGAQAGGHVVAIVPQWLKGDGLLRLQMVQSALDDEGLTIHETPLPPLAAAVLASLASAVAPHLPSVGVLVSLLGELEAGAARLHVAGQRQRPERARRPRSASTWPRSVPAARSASPRIPSPPCTSCGRDGAAGIPLPRIERPTRLAVSDHGGDAGWVQTVNAALGGLDVRTVEPTPNGPSWWGTGKLVESVAYPVDVQRLASRAGHRPPTRGRAAGAAS